jgi:hypothetical protein
MMYLIIITTNTYKVLGVAVATIVSLLLRVLLRVLVRVCKLGHTKPFRSSVMATSAVPTAVLSSVESNTQGHDLLVFSNDRATLHLATYDSMSRFNLCPSMVNRQCSVGSGASATSSVFFNATASSSKLHPHLPSTGMFDCPGVIVVVFATDSRD